jgi:hypothetical protein
MLNCLIRMRSDHAFSDREGLTDSAVLVVESLVEGLAEANRGLVTNSLVLLYANHMLSSCLVKYVTCKLRMATGDKNELRCYTL